MSILIKQIENNFTQVPNAIFVDKKVSLGGKGLYSYFISKPKKWEFSLNGLESQLKESKPTISNKIKELIERGYLKKIKNRKNGKQDTNSYLIFDKPNLSVLDSELKSLNQKIRIRKSESEILTTSNTISSNTLSSSSSREINFKKFKEIVAASNFMFLLCGKLGYKKNHKGFEIQNGYIFNLHTSMLLSSDESWKIWNYLFEKKDNVLNEVRKQQKAAS